MKRFGIVVKNIREVLVIYFPLCIVFSGIVSGPYAIGAEPKPVSVGKIKNKHRRCAMRIVPSLPPGNHSASDALVVEVSFLNDSANAIFIRDEKLADWPSLLPCLIEKGTGKFVDYAFIPSRMPPPRSKADYLRINPHSSLKITLNLALSELGIKRNGDYEMFFRYRSPSARGASFGLPAWSTEDGTIESEKTLLRIGN